MDKQSLEKKLYSEARYLQISIPYDEDEGLGLIDFNNGIETELQCEEGFVPPMYNSERRALEITVDLKHRRVLDWNEAKGYIHMWAKLRDCGTYTLLDEERRPLYQKEGYVPNALIPPYERGFGDYMSLAIESDGSLPEWRKELDFSDFLENGKEPLPDTRNQLSENMNEYIFFTAEGQTTAPNETYEVENCQMLGTAKGKDELEAKQNLLKENPWIEEAGFDSAEMMARQLAPES